ncbi:MAG: hypothetical protein QOI40_852 [Alphaproteobacteria bacterium]|jgi:hypothetical protein|nr:hypothetical protein [Alphaproteobacteria bacterium]
MLKAFHTQQSREAADNKAQAILHEPRASKMANQPTSSSRPSKRL